MATKYPLNASNWFNLVEGLRFENYFIVLYDDNTI
jgi:hypothetical protein